MPNSSVVAEDAAVPMGSFTGRSVLVCGAGLAGASAVRALLARGALVAVAEDRRPGSAGPGSAGPGSAGPGSAGPGSAGPGSAPTDPIETLVRAGARFCPDLSVVPADVDLIVASPGWRPDHRLFTSARARGVEVIGEVELAWRLRGADAPPWLAVTGTNGKTTTVRMLESILRAGGLSAVAVGNVGVSIIDAVLAGAAYDVLAVELSSFQLHWPSTFRPAAAALLNLAPDHLDWHGSMDDYAQTKARIWNTPIAIGNLDDRAVAHLLTTTDAGRSRRVGFTLGIPAPGQLGLLDATVIDRAFGSAVPLVGLEAIGATGTHNVANALAAAALSRAYGVEAEAVAAGLRAFNPEPHRNQFLARVSGVDYVDDSKATNPHAAAASLASYDRIVWIAGGQLKGAPVDELVATFANRLRAAVLLGEDRAQLVTALMRHAPDLPVIEVTLTDDGAMSEVVGVAAALAEPGDTVLLAPAAASYDMFSGYSARGEAFAAAVSELSGTAIAAGSR